MVLTAITLFFTYVYFEAKQTVYEYNTSEHYGAKLVHPVHFEKVSFSRKEIVEFWFYDPFFEEYIVWGLYSWDIDYTKIFDEYTSNYYKPSKN